jgi:GT2 family glycosyltransferase
LTRVAVVILNYNGEDFLRRFLPSVLANVSEPDAVWVADNASTDGSVNYILSLGEQVHLHQNKTNLGFAGGYNEAIAAIEAEYILLLNSDVEVSEGFLPPLLAALEADSNLVAVQPKVLAHHNKSLFEYAGAAGGYLDKLGYPYCKGRIFDVVESDQGQYNTPSQVFWTSGAAMLIRREAYLEVGGLDDHFFAHMEEIDLCWRLQRAGYTLGYVPESTVYHVGGGTLQTGSPKKTFLNFRNSLAMLVKNHPSNTWPLVIFTRMLLDGVAGLKFLTEGKPNLTWAIIRAHSAFYGWLPRLIQERKALKKFNAQPHTTVWKPSSILQAFYLQGKKKYSEL